MIFSFLLHFFPKGGGINRLIVAHFSVVFPRLISREFWREVFEFAFSGCSYDIYTQCVC